MCIRDRRAAGSNIAGDFTVKWQTVQDCLYAAVSDEQGVSRMNNFLALNHTKFMGAPLELLVNDVDREVDAFQGTWDKTREHCLYTHSLMTKYEIIYDIIRNLDSKFSQLKECAQKELSKLYFDPKGILDIPALQKHLYEKLDAKSLADLYTKELVHVGKRIPVQKASLKGGLKTDWTKEESIKFRLAFKGKALPNQEENENKLKLVTLIRELNKNKDLVDQSVHDNKDVSDLMVKNNIKCCFSCFSQNCQIKNLIARGMGLLNRVPRDCKRLEKNILRFGHIKDLKAPSEMYGDNPKGKKRTKISQRQASITILSEPHPSASNSSSSQPSLLDDLISFEAENNEEMDNEPMVISSNAFSTKVKPWFTEDTLPDFDAMFVDMKALDKVCHVCGIDGMDTMDMINHWADDYRLGADSSLEEWNAAKEEYQLESDYEPDSYPSSQEDSSDEPARDGSANRQDNSFDASEISRVVNVAFQENMGSFRQDIESELCSIRHEIEMQGKGDTLHDTLCVKRSRM